MSSLLTFGPVAAIALALLYILTAIVFAIDPVQKTRNAHQYAAALAINARFRMGLHALRVITAIIGLALVPIVYHSLKTNSWLDWSTLLAIIGFGSMLIGHARALFALPLIVKEHQEATEIVKPAIARQLSIVMLDPRGWVEIGGIGIWAITVTMVASEGVGAPWYAMIAAIIFGIASLLNVFGWISQRYGLINITMSIGLLVFGPVWFFWLAFFLTNRM